MSKTQVRKLAKTISSQYKKHLKDSPQVTPPMIQSMLSSLKKTVNFDEKPVTDKISSFPVNSHVPEEKLLDILTQATRKSSKLQKSQLIKRRSTLESSDTRGLSRTNASSKGHWSRASKGETDLVHEEFKARVFEYENKLAKLVVTADIFAAFDKLLEWTQIKPNATQYQDFVNQLKLWCAENPKKAKHAPKLSFNDFMAVVEKWYLANKPPTNRITPVQKLTPQTYLLLLMTIVKDYLTIRSYSQNTKFDKKLKEFSDVMGKLIDCIQQGKSLSDLNLGILTLEKEASLVLKAVSALNSDANAFVKETTTFYKSQMTIIKKNALNRRKTMTPVKFDETSISSPPSKRSISRSKTLRSLSRRKSFSRTSTNIKEEEKGAAEEERKTVPTKLLPQISLSNKQYVAIYQHQNKLLNCLARLQKAISENRPESSLKELYDSIQESRSAILNHWMGESTGSSYIARIDPGSSPLPNFSYESIKKENFYLTRLKLIEKTMRAAMRKGEILQDLKNQLLRHKNIIAKLWMSEVKEEKQAVRDEFRPQTPSFKSNIDVERTEEILELADIIKRYQMRKNSIFDVGPIDHIDLSGRNYRRSSSVSKVTHEMGVDPINPFFGTSFQDDGSPLEPSSPIIRSIDNNNREPNLLVKSQRTISVGNDDILKDVSQKELMIQQIDDLELNRSNLGIEKREDLSIFMDEMSFEKGNTARLNLSDLSAKNDEPKTDRFGIETNGEINIRKSNLTVNMRDQLYIGKDNGEKEQRIDTGEHERIQNIDRAIEEEGKNQNLMEIEEDIDIQSAEMQEEIIKSEKDEDNEITESIHENDEKVELNPNNTEIQGTNLKEEKKAPNKDNLDLNYENVKEIEIPNSEKTQTTSSGNEKKISETKSARKNSNLQVTDSIEIMKIISKRKNAEKLNPPAEPLGQVIEDSKNENEKLFVKNELVDIKELPTEKPEPYLVPETPHFNKNSQIETFNVSSITKEQSLNEPKESDYILASDLKIDKTDTTSIEMSETLKRNQTGDPQTVATNGEEEFFRLKIDSPVMKNVTLSESSQFTLRLGPVKETEPSNRADSQYSNYKTNHFPNGPVINTQEDIEQVQKIVKEYLQNHKLDEGGHPHNPPNLYDINHSIPYFYQPIPYMPFNAIPIFNSMPGYFDPYQMNGYYPPPNQDNKFVPENQPMNNYAEYYINDSPTLYQYLTGKKDEWEYGHPSRSGIYEFDNSDVNVEISSVQGNIPDRFPKDFYAPSESVEGEINDRYAELKEPQLQLKTETILDKPPSMEKNKNSLIEESLYLGSKDDKRKTYTRDVKIHDSRLDSDNEDPRTNQSQLFSIDKYINKLQGKAESHKKDNEVRHSVVDPKPESKEPFDLSPVENKKVIDFYTESPVDTSKVKEFPSTMGKDIFDQIDPLNLGNKNVGKLNLDKLKDSSKHISLSKKQLKSNTPQALKLGSPGLQTKTPETLKKTGGKKDLNWSSIQSLQSHGSANKLKLEDSQASSKKLPMLNSQTSRITIPSKTSTPKNSSPLLSGVSRRFSVAKEKRRMSNKPNPKEECQKIRDIITVYTDLKLVKEARGEDVSKICKLIEYYHYLLDNMNDNVDTNEKVDMLVEQFKMLEQRPDNLEKEEIRLNILRELDLMVNSELENHLNHSYMLFLSHCFSMYAGSVDFMDLESFLRMCEDYNIVKRHGGKLSTKIAAKLFEQYANSNGFISLGIFRNLVRKLAEHYFASDKTELTSFSILNPQQKFEMLCEHMQRFKVQSSPGYNHGYLPEHFSLNSSSVSKQSDMNRHFASRISHNPNSRTLR